MAEIVLKNRDGNPVTHEGAIAMNVLLSDGTEQMMLPGEAEEKTVNLDFSAGDMTVTPSEGKLLTEVNIPKPENLVPENIAEGVDIAGIIGTFAAGGTGNIEVYTESNWYAEKYSYSGAVNTYKTVVVTLPKNAKVLKVVSGYGLTYGSGTSYDHIPHPEKLSEANITPTSDDNHVYVSTSNLAYKPNRNYGGMYLCLIVFYTLE